MKPDLVTLVGDDTFHAARVVLPPAIRLAAMVNAAKPPHGLGTVVQDLSGPAGTREVVRRALAALARRGPVLGSYDRAVLLVSLSVGDLRGGGMNPSDWRGHLVALTRTATALGYRVALLHVVTPDGFGTKEARRWCRRLTPEVGRLLTSEQVETCLDVEARGWADPLDPGDDGAADIALAALRLLNDTSDSCSWGDR